PNHGEADMSIRARSSAACIVALTVLAALGGCASGGGGATASSPALVTEEAMIPSADPGISLYVRNKAPAGMQFSGEKTVLFVHGATYPSETTFDLKLGEQSWMDYIAAHGYDVWLVDVRGYGRSSKTAALS